MPFGIPSAANKRILQFTQVLSRLFKVKALMAKTAVFHGRLLLINNAGIDCKLKNDIYVFTESGATGFQTGEAKSS